MSDKYHRLCAVNRKVIANMKQAGRTQIEIAQATGLSQGTISKELSRNRGQRGYDPLRRTDSRQNARFRNGPDLK